MAVDKEALKNELRGKHCPKCWGTGSVVNHRLVGTMARARREKVGMPLAVMARMMGISEPFLSLLERGKRSWSHKRLMTYDRYIRRGRDSWY